MLLLIGASASGKTEIAKELIRNHKMKKMVTYTTRPMREGETDGIDYHFLKEARFKELQANDFFLETSIYHHNYYGTAFKDAMQNTVLIVDPDGANAIYNKLKENVVIFLIETPENIRRIRMLSRGDKESQIKSRLALDNTYFDRSRLEHTDKIIENTNQSLQKISQKIYQDYTKKFTLSD